MRKKISRYISLLLLICSLTSIPLQAATDKKGKKDKEALKAEYKESPIYQGTAIGVEVAGLANHILGSDILSTEVQIQSNFKNRFMPTLEVGYGKTNTINDANDIHYKTNAPYFRIGMDYNIFYLKTYLPGYLYAGLRYGWSSFSYDVDGPDMKDPNYGGQITVPFAATGQDSKAHWAEAIVGIKVRIYKSFHMGWSLRYKRRMSVTNHENSVPWYIPGYGKNAGSCFCFSYNLIYNLPF